MLSAVVTSGSSRLLVRKSEFGHRDVINRDSKAHVNEATRPRPRRNTVAAYFSLNIIFTISVFLLSFFGHKSGHNPALYLVLLVALLSTPLLFARSFTGPYLVLWVSVPFFILMFGFADFVAYFSDASSVQAGRSGSILTIGETGVLVAILCMFLGYSAAVRMLKSKSGRWFVGEWSDSSILFVGLTFFTVGLITSIVFYVQFSAFQIFTPSKINPLMVNALILGKMMGDLGEILLAYVALKTRNRTITIFIIALMVLKLPLGLVLNKKSVAVSFIAIYMVVAWIYNKKIPWKIILVGGLAVALVFPLAYTYRSYMGKYHVTVGESLGDISGHLGKALSKDIDEQKKRGLMDAVMGGVESIAGRANMKPAVELIMERSGRDVPYQNGHTLTPLLYVLIPRMILPDKPFVAVGLLYSEEFDISPSRTTWISTSFIGELYWNFSWIGIIAGMLIVGYTYGAVGSITNMDARTNVVRLLIVLMTIATLVLKFETGIAQQYSVFIRSFIIIIFLHLLFSKRKKQVGAA